MVDRMVIVVVDGESLNMLGKLWNRPERRKACANRVSALSSGHNCSPWRFVGVLLATLILS